MTYRARRPRVPRGALGCARTLKHTSTKRMPPPSRRATRLPPVLVLMECRIPGVDRESGDFLSGRGRNPGTLRGLKVPRFDQKNRVVIHSFKKVRRPGPRQGSAGPPKKGERRDGIVCSS